MRRFVEKWFDKYRWLDYSTEVDKKIVIIVLIYSKKKNLGYP